MEHNKSFETRKAFELLASGKRGDVITAEQMSTQIGKDAWTNPGYRYVHTAIRQVIKQGVYWYRDRFGRRYVCGSVDDVNKAQQSLLRQSARRAKRSLDVAMCVETSEMNQEQRNQHNLSTLVAGLVVTATSGSARKQMEGRKLYEPHPNDLLKLITRE